MSKPVYYEHKRCNQHRSDGVRDDDGDKEVALFGAFE